MSILEKRRSPIAIVGIGCRFPGGASSPEAFWELLINGVDAIIEVPKDRWDIRRFYDPDTDKPSKMHVKQAGFLKEPFDEFDPLFFDISPREAMNLDPQQRLLLEVTYEAFDDAGLQVEHLKGSDTGVFIGGFGADNLLLHSSPYNRGIANQHSATSSTLVMLSNRISYSFDFMGPSITIDTACSSSLVAMHYACQSLWHGECSLAVVGGVNFLFSKEYFIAMSKGHFLSKHSRCKAFDADAAGYVRGEGAGVIILKPYVKAVEDNDPIYTLIKATGVNQDGRTTGISVPNPDAQVALIRNVYERAVIDVNSIHYVEAHGTGTKVGDPIELRSLHTVLSEGRNPGNKCLVGSLKTNIGHLEAAAGVASVIKTALCLKHKQIPPHVHFHTPNPNIDFDKLCLKIPTQVEELPKDQISYASINGFGYGGTNAHIVLQEVPQSGIKAGPERENIPIESLPAPPLRKGEEKGKGLFLAPVTARGERALRAVSKRYAKYLSERKPNFQDFLYTTYFRRSHHRTRLAIVAESAKQLADKLTSYSEGILLQGMATNQANLDEKPKVVFVFTGMGPQWWAMGRELMDKVPLFRQKLEEYDQVFTQHAGWSILEALLADEDTSRMAETQVAQPANFVIQAALTELWKFYGIEPEAVVGHSVGEVTASYVSGALSLDDAMLVSFHRSRLQQTTAGQGTMLAIGMSEAEASELIKDVHDVSIAAINSPSSVTLSGKEMTLQELETILETKQVFHRMLKVEVPYHSYLMDTIQEELLESLKGIRANETQVPLYSTVTGARIQGIELGVNYWWQNVRQPVRFAKAIETLIREGYTIFLEVGPHPVLRNSIRECLHVEGKEGHLVSSLNRKEPELLNFYEALGTFYTLGIDINWKRIATDGKYIKLPSYPWQRARYWHETELSRQDRLGRPGHLFLNNKLPTAQPAWEVELNDLFFPYLKDHKVQGMIVFPGAAYVEIGLALHQEIEQDSVCTLENLEFHNVLPKDETRSQILHSTFHLQTRKYFIYSRFDEEDADWLLHATGRILSKSIGHPDLTVDLKKLRAQCPKKMSTKVLYDHLAEIGLHYGPCFQGIRELYLGEDTILMRIEGHDSLVSNEDGYLLHPAILDSGIQAILLLVKETFVPVSVGRVNYYRSPGNSCWTHVKIHRQTKNSLQGSSIFFDEDGNITVEVLDIFYQAIARSEEQEKSALDTWYYDFTWQETESVPQSSVEDEQTSRWLVFTNQSETVRILIEKLAEEHVACTRVTPGDEYCQLAENHFQIRRDEPADMQRVMTETLNKHFAHILYLWSWDGDHQDEQIKFTETVDACMPVVYIVQALSKIRPDDHIPLTIVTCHAQVVAEGDRGDGINKAPLWGLGHLIGNEHPNIFPKLIDIAGGLSNLQLLVNELLSGNSDEDVAFRSGNRLVKTLQRRFLLEEVGQATKMVSTDTPVELCIGSRGKLDSLYYKKIDRIPPKTGEIEVQVQASALNFKDVLKALGKISPKATEGTYFEDAFGMECSGVVTRVGEGVTEFQIGDQVVASPRTGALKSYITLPITYVLPKPRHLKFTESLFVVPYLTVYYGLKHIARLQKGEKILIHNATGSVGLAAVQLAQWKGAEIFATAGNSEKRAYLKSLGIKHVMHSRTLEFARTIKEVTDGYGIDVVISAMAGEALQQSFALLAPYGRYIEIGKKDIVENSGLPMGVFNRNTMFAAIDIDRLVKEREALAKQLLQDVYQGFEKGYFQPLPTRVFPAAEAREAFAHFAQSKHIGRIVLDFHDQEIEVPVKKMVPSIHNQATYLITGGTRGFGLEVGKWLASQGARNIVLISRRGATTDAAKTAIAQMEYRGARVLAAAVDVTDEYAIEQLIRNISTTMPPLRGIFHGAMVLDDGFLVDLNKDRFIKVMLPKVGGALSLHKYTRDIPLDFFMSFSSIASLLGSQGQGNYIAANAFLDAFSHFRTAQGLPAITVNLGVLEEVGVAARHSEVKAVAEHAGIRGFSTKEALWALDVVLKQQPVQVGIFDIDWQNLAQNSPRGAKSSRFRKIIESLDSADTLFGNVQQLVDQLAEMSKKGQQSFMEALLSEQVAHILRLPVESLETNRGINVLGIDSLMVVELVRAIQRETGVEVSTIELLRGPTITQLATTLLDRMSHTEGD